MGKKRIKYLHNDEAGIWQCDFYIKVGRKKRRIQNSLGHRNDKRAQEFVDTYILPIIRIEKERDLFERLILSYEFADKKLKNNYKDFLSQFSESENIIDSFRELSDRYIEWKQNSDLSPATINRYKCAINDLLKFLGDDIEVEDITKKNMTEYRDMLQERGMHNNTIREQVKRINSVFRWGVDEGKILLREPPGLKVRVEKQDQDHYRCPDDDEIEPLCNMPYPNSARSFDLIAWKYIPLISRYTTMRIGEVAQLLVTDIDYKDGLRIFKINRRDGKSTKNKQSIRLVPVPDKLDSIVDELLEIAKQSNSSRLFVKCGDYTSPNSGLYKPAHHFLCSFNNQAKKVNREEGQPNNDLSFHCLRSWGSTKMIEEEINIIDIQRIMGHKTRITLAGYTKESMKRYKKWLDMIP